MIISSSTDIVCEEETWWPTTMRGLPGAQFGDSQKPLPRTPYLGDA